jgi:hypothetical protein
LRSKSRFAESVPLIFIFLNNPPYNKQFNCIAIDLIQINFFILTLATVHLLPRFQRLIKRAYVKFKCQTLERYRVDIANGARVAHLRLHGRVHFCQLINVTNCFVSILTNLKKQNSENNFEIHYYMYLNCIVCNYNSISDKYPEEQVTTKRNGKNKSRL